MIAMQVYGPSIFPALSAAWVGALVLLIGFGAVVSAALQKRQKLRQVVLAVVMAATLATQMYRVTHQRPSSFVLANYVIDCNGISGWIDVLCWFYEW